MGAPAPNLPNPLNRDLDLTPREQPMHRFPFTYDVKGTVAEVVTAAVFRDAGCHVVPCGLHTLMPHVPALDKARYDALPEPLRRLPDLHILPPSGSPVWIETKFIKHFDPKAAGRIHRKVTAQLRHYPDLFTVRAGALRSTGLLLAGRVAHATQPSCRPARPSVACSTHTE